MKQTGQILRECREKKGLSASEVAMATKIGLKIIEAIERGDIHSLPPKAFLRGFIQTYATFLKLDSKEIMQGYLEETGGKNRLADPSSAPHAVEAPRAPTPLAFENKNNRVFIQVAIVCGVLLIFWVVKFLFSTIEKYEHDAKPPTPAEIATTLKSDVPIQAADTDTKTLLPSTPAPVAPTPIAPPQATAPLSPPPAAIAKTPPAAAAVVKVAPTPPVTKSEEPKKSLSTETGASIQSKELIIEALDAVDLIYWADDGQSKKVRLETDQIQIIKAAKKITVEVSDGGAIDVIFNGEDQGVPGKLGKSMKLSYP